MKKLYFTQLGAKGLVLALLQEYDFRPLKQRHLQIPRRKVHINFRSQRPRLGQISAFLLTSAGLVECIKPSVEKSIYQT
jgi:hypothetical protein